MGFRLGFLSGFGAGYYFGARAGPQRYEQINRAVDKARRSPVVETATEKARSVVNRDGTEDAGGTATPLPIPAPDVSVEVPTETAVVDPDDYSSSR